MIGDWDLKALFKRVDALENLFRIDGLLQDILRKEEMIMATAQGLDAKLDAMNPKLDAIAADAQAQKVEIQALKDQIAAGTPVTQEQLDSLDAKADSVLNRLGSIDDSVPGPVVP
jgi:predicted  nucleic acid-binding Zn-ribbon protein